MKTVGDRSDACGEDATTHAVTAANVVVGEIDIGNDLKVSWQTDCGKQEIEFIVEAKTPSQVGWLALGLIDGGDAANPLGKTPNSMQGTDIVMLSPFGGTKLKDALGVGYVAPHAKKSATATYLAGGYQCGYTWARFKRPFSADAKEGHTLKADGFVYLVASYSVRTPGDFGQKHDRAQAMRLKMSLFGGRGESYRKKDSKVEPESEPEPEAEAEKKVNKPLFKGKCTNPIPTMDKCWAWAGNAGVVFTESVQMHKGKKKVPTGCFYHPDKTILYLNTHRRGSDCGKKGFGCICQSKHPEPEPEPEALQPWKVEAGVCTKVFTEAQCLPAAKKAYGGNPSSLKTVADLDLPKGCFVKKSGEVFYNTQSDSRTECHHTGVKGCVCAVEVKVITRAPAPAPPPPPVSGAGPEVAYKDVREHCVSSNVVNKDECKAKAEEYIKKHNLGFKIKRFRVFSTKKWPTGCWILKRKKRVFFNRNTASTVKCGNGGSWCMCKASFVIARKGSECTHVITTPEECQDAATEQGFNLKVIIRKKHKRLMAGCYMRKKKLYFAIGSGGINVCGRRKTACICEA